MTIRPGAVQDAAGIARVHVESWRTTYKGIFLDDFLAGLSVERREKYWHEQLSNVSAIERVVVAEDETGQIVGFASGGPIRDALEGFDSELYIIYLLANAQGKGLGRGLLKQVGQQLQDDGWQALMLWVLEANASGRGFYEAMGGELLPVDKTLTLEGMEFREVAYGWRDLNRLKASGSV